MSGNTSFVVSVCSFGPTVLPYLRSESAFICGWFVFIRVHSRLRFVFFRGLASDAFVSL